MSLAGCAYGFDDDYSTTIREENKQLRAENEKLVLAIADHVTVRSEQRQEIERLKQENELYAAEMSAAREAGFYSAQELFMAYQNLKAECAKAEKDAGLWREREAKIKSLKERGFLKSPLRDGPYNFVIVYF